MPVSIISHCIYSISLKLLTGLLNEDEVLLQHLDGESSGVSVIALNRPRAKNAISVRFLKLFTEALDELKHDKSVRPVVVRSLVPGVFCAGADLKERAKVNRNTYLVLTSSTLNDVIAVLELTRS